MRIEQELSYRKHKQIARQLRTQYAEGIYRHKYYTMTVKSRSRVTHGHWRRSHWIDHTRLSIVIELLFDAEYYRDLENGFVAVRYCEPHRLSHLEEASLHPGLYKRLRAVVGREF